MSTLRVSNIEAKADPSSPSVDEKLKFTNSNGDVLLHLDGKTSGITTVGINTTSATFSVDNNQNVEFLGIVTATKFSLSGGGEITGGDGNFTGIVTAGSLSVTGNVSIGGTLTYEDVTSIDSIGIITARDDVHVGAGLSVVGISTLANTNINGQLTATNARITGVTTFGTSSTTINGALEYPSIRPTLDLNFAATKTLDRRITFTRDSLGTYTDELGIVRTVSNNTPRFDHDPVTGESLGLLIEESRTNFITNSETPLSAQGSNLTSSYLTVSAVSNVVSPDGTTNGVVRYTTNANGSGTYRFGNTTDGIAETTYTGSIWIKSATGSDQTMTVDVNDRGTLVFTATTEWRRVSVSAAREGAFTHRFMDINSGVSKDFYIWGPQLELGSFATSYIPTSGSTVTRAADLAKITGTNFTGFYNQTEGTFFIDSGIARGSSYVGYLGTGTSSAADSGPSYNFNAILSDDDNSDIVFDIFNGNVGAQAFISILNSTTQRHRIAGAYASNDFAISLNGSSPSTDPSGTADPNQDQFWIGRRPYTSAGWLNNSIKKISYYNKRLPNAQLQGLTAQ